MLLYPVLIADGVLNVVAGVDQCPVELNLLAVAVPYPVLFLYSVHSEHRLPKRHLCFDVLLLMLATFLYLQAVAIANPADPLQRRS